MLEKIDEFGNCRTDCNWPEIDPLRWQEADKLNQLIHQPTTIQCTLADSTQVATKIPLSALFQYLLRSKNGLSINKVCLVGSYLQEIQNSFGWTEKHIQMLLGKELIPKEVLERLKSQKASDSDWRFYLDAMSTLTHATELSREVQLFFTHCFYSHFRSADSPFDEYLFNTLANAVRGTSFKKFKLFSPSPTQTPPLTLKKKQKETSYSIAAFGDEVRIPADLMFIHSLARECLFDLDGGQLLVDTPSFLASNGRLSSPLKIKMNWQQIIDQATYVLHVDDLLSVNEMAYIKNLVHLTRGACYLNVGAEKHMLTTMQAYHAEDFVEKLGNQVLTDSVQQKDPLFATALVLRTLGSLKQHSVEASIIEDCRKNMAAKLKLLPQSQGTHFFMCIKSLLEDPSIPFDLIYNLCHSLFFINLCDSGTDINVYLTKQENQPAFELAQTYHFATMGDVESAFALSTAGLQSTFNQLPTEAQNKMSALLKLMAPKGGFNRQSDNTIRRQKMHLNIDIESLQKTALLLLSHLHPVIKNYAYNMLLACYGQQTTKLRPTLFYHFLSALFQLPEGAKKTAFCLLLSNTFENTAFHPLIGQGSSLQKTECVYEIIDLIDAENIQDMMTLWTSSTSPPQNKKETGIYLLEKLIPLDLQQAISFLQTLRGRYLLGQEYYRLFMILCKSCQGLTDHGTRLLAVASLKNHAEYISTNTWENDPKPEAFIWLLLELLQIDPITNNSLIFQAIGKGIIPNTSKKAFLLCLNACAILLHHPSAGLPSAFAFWVKSETKKVQQKNFGGIDANTLLIDILEKLSKEPKEAKNPKINKIATHQLLFAKCLKLVDKAHLTAELKGRLENLLELEVAGMLPEDLEKLLQDHRTFFTESQLFSYHLELLEKAQPTQLMSLMKQTAACAVTAPQKVQVKTTITGLIEKEPLSKQPFLMYQILKDASLSALWENKDSTKRSMALIAFEAYPKDLELLIHLLKNMDAAFPPELVVSLITVVLSVLNRPPKEFSVAFKEEINRHLLLLLRLCQEKNKHLYIEFLQAAVYCTISPEMTESFITDCFSVCSSFITSTSKSGLRTKDKLLRTHALLTSLQISEKAPSSCKKEQVNFYLFLISQLLDRGSFDNAYYWINQICLLDKPSDTNLLGWFNSCYAQKQFVSAGKIHSHVDSNTEIPASTLLSLAYALREEQPHVAVGILKRHYPSLESSDAIQVSEIVSFFVGKIVTIEETELALDVLALYHVADSTLWEKSLKAFNALNLAGSRVQAFLIWDSLKKPSMLAAVGSAPDLWISSFSESLKALSKQTGPVALKIADERDFTPLFEPCSYIALLQLHLALISGLLHTWDSTPSLNDLFAITRLRQFERPISGPARSIEIGKLINLMVVIDQNVLQKVLKATDQTLFLVGVDYLGRVIEQYSTLNEYAQSFEETKNGEPPATLVPNQALAKLIILSIEQLSRKESKERNESSSVKVGLIAMNYIKPESPGSEHRFILIINGLAQNSSPNCILMAAHLMTIYMQRASILKFQKTPKTSEMQNICAKMIQKLESLLNPQQSGPLFYAFLMNPNMDHYFDLKSSNKIFKGFFYNLCHNTIENFASLELNQATCLFIDRIPLLSTEPDSEAVCVNMLFNLLVRGLVEGLNDDLKAYMRWFNNQFTDLLLLMNNDIQDSLPPPLLASPFPVKTGQPNNPHRPAQSSNQNPKVESSAVLVASEIAIADLDTPPPALSAVFAKTKNEKRLHQHIMLMLSKILEIESSDSFFNEVALEFVERYLTYLVEQRLKDNQQLMKLMEEWAVFNLSGHDSIGISERISSVGQFSEKFPLFFKEKPLFVLKLFMLISNNVNGPISNVSAIYHPWNCKIELTSELIIDTIEAASAVLTTNSFTDKKLVKNVYLFQSTLAFLAEPGHRKAPLGLFANATGNKKKPLQKKINHYFLNVMTYIKNHAFTPLISESGAQTFAYIVFTEVILGSALLRNRNSGSIKSNYEHHLLNLLVTTWLSNLYEISQTLFNGGNKYNSLPLVRNFMLGSIPATSLESGRGPLIMQYMENCIERQRAGLILTSSATSTTDIAYTTIVSMKTLLNNPSPKDETKFIVKALEFAEAVVDSLQAQKTTVIAFSKNLGPENVLEYERTLREFVENLIALIGNGYGENTTNISHIANFFENMRTKGVFKGFSAATLTFSFER